MDDNIIIFKLKEDNTPAIKNPLSKSVSHYLSKTLEELGGNPDHTEVYKVLLKN